MTTQFLQRSPYTGVTLEALKHASFLEQNNLT